MDAKSFKSAFFDKKAITEKIDPAIRRALSRFGAILRQDVKKSLKYKKGASRPGSPPNVHRSTRFTRETKRKGKVSRQPSSPLRELMLFAFDASKKSVIVGPAFGGSHTGAPLALEEGGTAAVSDDGGMRRIRIAPRPYMRPKFESLRGKSAELFGGIIK